MSLRQPVATVPAPVNVATYREALPRVKSELRRARRYERPCAMLVISAAVTIPSSRDMRSGMSEQDYSLFFLLGTYLRNVLRETDLLTMAPEALCYALFLAETDGDGVARATERLDAGFRAYANSACRIGTAVFPRDGVTVEDLVEIASLQWEQAPLSAKREPSMIEGVQHG